MTDVGDLIAGRYRLVNRIAVGGMGVVWEGRDELLGRRVAVKQVSIQPGLSEADALLARDRVIREARITARLHHPQAVTIYDVVDDGDYPSLIMQFVPSSSLTGLLRERGTLPPSQVSRIGVDLAAALNAAHQVGIVHRDVKPGNVLITADGSAKLTDFGISHAAGDVTLTSTGMVTGTPAYLAPEVARGGRSDFSTDVFSLGATLYACVEGTPPFGLDPNPMAVLHRVASGRIVPPQRSGPLTALLLRMLAAEPADRPTMSEVSATLTLPGIDPPPPTRATPTERIATQTLPVSPPALPVSPPAAIRTPRRRFPAAAVVAVVGVVLVVVLIAGYFLLRPTGGGQGTVAASPAGRTGTAGVASVPAQSPSAAVTSPSPTADSTRAAGTSMASRASTSPAASSGPTSSAPTSSAPTSTSPPTGAAPSAAALARSVSDYYALMPGDTDAGWARLTQQFQTGIAKNRDSYNSFWGGVERVTAADVVATAPNTVQATITYHFTDGTVSVERTEYRLARQGAAFKIDNSTVLSSR